MRINTDIRLAINSIEIATDYLKNAIKDDNLCTQDKIEFDTMTKDFSHIVKTLNNIRNKYSQY